MKYQGYSDLSLSCIKFLQRNESFPIFFIYELLCIRSSINKFKGNLNLGFYVSTKTYLIITITSLAKYLQSYLACHKQLHIY